MDSNIILKFIRGQHTPEEKKQIVMWLDADPVKHQKEFDEIRFVFEASILFDTELQNIEKDKKSSRFFDQYRSQIYRSLRYAAIVLLVVGASYFTYDRTYDSISSKIMIFEVPPGQRVKLDLADGSKIWLNADTKIEYPVIFDKDTRRIKISGEAMFEITHDEGWPFVVETYVSNITVLGTKFNVLADEANSLFSTTLVDGAVKLSNKLGEQPAIYMQPNDIVILENGYLYKDVLTDSNTLCWMDGLINIKKPFDELMIEFEKTFDVKIIIERATTPTIDYRSGQLRVSEGVEHAMTILQYASNFTFDFDKKNNIIIIR